MKRQRTIIERGRLTGPLKLMGLIGLMGLTGCASEDDELTEARGPVLEVATFMAGFEDYTLTRAWTPPTDFTAYESSDLPIGIALTKDGETIQTGSLFKGGGQWRTNLEDIAADDYYLYGYVPYLSSVALDVTDLEGHSAKFSDGATVTLQNVPAVMPNDLCVVVGAKDGTGEETVTDLRMGDFAFNAKAVKKGTDTTEKNHVFLLLDHLYSALRINMRVHGDYAALRTIKLKSLKLRTEIKGETSLPKDRYDITISLKANVDGTNPIQSVDYVPSGHDIVGDVTFWSSGTGRELTTEYEPYVGHFMPMDISTLVLTSVYDVYDTKGNLIRRNCKAVNTMVLEDVLSGLTDPSRGTRYTINMTVQPTFLYMLSEPDLDSPTVKIN